MADRQKEFPWLRDCRKPADERTDVLLQIGSFRRCLRHQWLTSGLSLESLTDLLGMGKSTLSEILSGAGRKCLNPELYLPFCYATGSRALYQWLALEDQGRIGKQARIAELEAELAELKGAA